MTNTSPEITKWFNKYKTKRSKAQVIEAGLLKGNLTTYYYYRLRYFLVRSIVGALIFSIEIKILIEGFGKDFFTQSLGARTGVMLLVAFWWAGLEILRSNIREFKREEKSYLIPRIILDWRQWAFSITLKLVSIAILVAGTIAVIDPNLVFNPYGFYLITLICRIAVDIPLRTYHSSVYATMRIYRPIYWILATEIFSFILFLTLKPSIGAWSVGVASILSLTLSSSISYHYITRTFNYLGYKTGIRLLEGKKREGKSFIPTLKNFALKAFPLTIFRLDAVLVLLLLLGSATTSNSLSYNQIILIGLCVPLLYAAQEWSMLLYFDYKKLELKIFKILRKKFTTGLKYLIIAMATCLWLLLPVLQWITGLGFSAPPLPILALLLASSFLGQQAIKTFSVGSNKDLTRWGISLLIFLTSLILLTGSYPMNERLLLMSCVLLGHALGMSIFCKEQSISAKRIMIAPSEWLWHLKGATLPWGGLIRIKTPKPKEQDNTKFLIKEAARGLRKCLPGPIYTTSVSRTGLLFFGEGKSLIDSNFPTDPSEMYKTIHQKIVPLLPTALEKLFILPIEISNQKFLENLSEAEKKLKACLEEEIPQVEDPPDTRTFNFESSESGGQVTTEESRELFSGAIRYFYNIDIRPDKLCRKWEVACEESKGAISQIKAIPKKRNQVSMWLYNITRQNLWKAWHKQ